MDGHANRGGFTLLELMISLTIISLIVVIIFGAFSVGSRACEKGEQDVNIRQRLRIVLELVKRQLSSACRRTIKIDGDETVLFKGEKNSLDFASRLFLVPGKQSGVSYVKYVVESDKGDQGESLKLFEMNDLSLNESDLKTPDKDDYHILISGMKNIWIEYLKKHEDGAYKWQDVWDPKEEEFLPLAVRMAFECADDSDSAVPIYVVARIH